MLVQLHVENFALIDKLTFEFDRGLNVLTGETGAGKSIIIDAVKIVLAGRASADLIRAGCDWALVEAVFDTAEAADIRGLLESYGLEPEEDGALLISREFNRSGRNTCRVNGRAVTLTQCRELGQYLIDIHGQHDHQSLLLPSKHLSLLDCLGDASHQKNLDNLKEIQGQIKEMRHILDGIGGDARDQARRLDILRYQLEEIDKAGLKPQEEEALLEERNLLQNGEKLSAAALEAYALLQGGHRQGDSALDLLSQGLLRVKELATLDRNLIPLLEALEEARFVIEDKAGEIRAYGDRLDFDPGRLEEIEERLLLIKNLKKKYGNTIEDILTFRDYGANELAEIEGREEKVRELEGKIISLEAQFNFQGSLLTAKRKELAVFLASAVEAELDQLGMQGTTFMVDIRAREDLSRDGLDKVEFLFSPNLGEALKPLAKVASGGEMSRVMLALKTILAKVDNIATLIFDEVDAGIGGQAAGAVAEKLTVIAQTSQVLCVTHSAKIASYAGKHFYIYKEEIGQRTYTRVIQLDEEQRIQELARMLGGAKSDAALLHAREMLILAKNAG